MVDSITAYSPAGSDERLFVIKRDGKTQPCNQSKIIQRITKLCAGLDENHIDAQRVAQKTVMGLYPGVRTSELDELAAEEAASRIRYHPDYGVLAARLAVSNLHKHVPKSLRQVANNLYNFIHPKLNVNKPLLSKSVYDIICANEAVLQAALIHDNDYNYEYFGFKTLCRYLLKIDKNPAERPQHMYMRVAIQCFGDDIPMVVKTYRFLSAGWFTVASPAYFHAGTPRPSLSSCFLLTMQDDSIEGIYETLKRCAIISKNAGGIGLDTNIIRSENSYIAGTNGYSNGLVPMLRNFNSTARYVDQGGNRRPGAFANYIEPWHPDVEKWLLMKCPLNGLKDTDMQTGTTETKGLDLFYALWIEDEFFRRAQATNPADRKWSLMDPHECPGLSDVYGDEFVALYKKYEAEGKARKVIDAQELLFMVISVQIETGGPYMCSKTAANAKSNQKNIGIVRSSNLCVDGSTLILTKSGYHSIQALADERKKILAKLDEQALISDSDEEGAERDNIDDEIDAQIKSMYRVDTATVDVWNGRSWSAVEVMQTGENVPVMTVETSFGVRLSCTPEHKFVLLDGTITAAKDLVLGQQLARQVETPTEYANRPAGYFVNYPGDDKVKLANPYLNGFIIGYFLKKQGMEKRFLTPFPDVIELPIMVLDATDQNLLEKLGYDPTVELPEGFHIPGKDGLIPGVDKLKNDLGVVYMPVPEHQRRLRWALAATPDIREEWVKGFIRALGQLEAASGSHYFLRRCALMIQSTGRNCRMESLNDVNSEAYKLRWCLTPDEVPTVVALRRANRTANVYCFSEPELHQGVFEGQLTGQCTEIMEVAKPNEIASCNLASVALNNYANLNEIFDHAGFQSSAKPNKHYDFKTLHDVTKHVTYVLNRVIDVNYYPLGDMVRGPNMRDRPLGIGIQGLADTFCLLRYPFTGPDARNLNRHIFECMYHAFLEASCEIAQRDGFYETFPGSPASEGKLQFDLWDRSPDETWLYSATQWDDLRQLIVKHGIRNSLGLALMPTATTAQVLGNNEAMEPFTSNLYARKVSAGNFFVVNKHLIRELIHGGYYTKSIRDQIVKNRGSIQDISEIPQDIKEIYRTVWEIKQTALAEMMADRSIFVCQSSSFNWHIANPTVAKMTTMIYKCWNLGLKTLMYYLRSQSSTEAAQFTTMPNKGHELQHPHEIESILDSSSNKNIDDRLSEEDQLASAAVCFREKGTACESCQS